MRNVYETGITSMVGPAWVTNKTSGSQLTILVRLASGFHAVHEINRVADMSCQPGIHSDDGREDLTDRDQRLAQMGMSRLQAHTGSQVRMGCLRCMARYRYSEGGGGKANTSSPYVRKICVGKRKVKLCQDERTE